MALKCRFRNKNGQPCKADAQVGKSVCVFHDPEMAIDVRRARRLGGINRTRPVCTVPSETSDNPLQSTNDVSRLLAESINQVRRGQLAPRLATAIGYLANILLAALEQGPLEDRLSALEALLGLPNGCPKESTTHAEKSVGRQN